MEIIYYIALCFSPYLFIISSKYLGVDKLLSPVVLCYGFGLLIGNLFPNLIPTEIPKTLTEGTIALAIPLILMNSDFKAFINGTKNILLSYLFAIIAVFITCVSGVFIFHQSISDAPEIGGMLAGVYTGGTPNMSSIQIALDASPDTFGILTVLDIILSGIYLLMLMSIGPKLFRWVFPNTIQKENITEETIDNKLDNSWYKLPFKNKIISLIPSLVLSIIIVCISIGLNQLIFGEIKEAVFIILITLFGILVSLFSFSKKLKGAYEAGDYLLLIFSFALGFLSDFTNIIGASSSIILFVVYVLLGTILIHLLLSYLFKIDSDTVIITSVACIFGPVFVGQIVSVLKNKSMLVPGMAMGVVGYAIGSFFGITIYYLTHWLIQ